MPSVIVAVSSYLFFEVVGAVYYLLAGVLIGNIYEGWRRWGASRRRIVERKLEPETRHST